MYQYLIEEFKELNKEVPNIHFGGCCVFAESLYKLLMDLGKKPKIVILTNTKDTLIHCINNNINDNEAEISIAHTVIECDGKYIDNTGIYGNVREFPHWTINYSDIEISIEDLKFINKDFKNWNPRFNRGNINRMKKILNNLTEKLGNLKQIPYLCIEPIKNI